LRIPGVRAARRCFLYVGQAMEDEVIVVDANEFYAVGTVLTTGTSYRLPLNV